MPDESELFFAAMNDVRHWTKFIESQEPLNIAALAKLKLLHDQLLIARGNLPALVIAADKVLKAKNELKEIYHV